MKSLRDEIKSDIYMISGGKDNVGIRWVDCDKITDSILSKIEKRINSIQDIKNMKPAEKPEDVIYNVGVWDGMEKIKKEIKKK